MANNDSLATQKAELMTGPINGEQAISGATEEAWDEERLEASLKTLKEMHIQLRNLRTTIPRLIAPLTIKQPSPESLVREFTDSINTANKEVQEFRALMTSEEGVKVMAQARKSRAENPSGIKPWKATDHPDWLTRDS